MVTTNKKGVFAVERKITVMSSEELFGALYSSIDFEKEYPELFDMIKLNRSRKTLDEIFEEYCEKLDTEIFDYRMLTDDEAELLNLPYGKTWWIDSYNNRYIKNC